MPLECLWVVYYTSIIHFEVIFLTVSELFAILSGDRRSQKRKKGPKGHFPKPEIHQNHTYETTHGTAHHCKNSADRAHRGRHEKDFKIFYIRPPGGQSRHRSDLIFTISFRVPTRIICSKFQVHRPSGFRVEDF